MGGGGCPLPALDKPIGVPHLGYVERDGFEHTQDVIPDRMPAEAPIAVVNPELLERTRG